MESEKFDLVFSGQLLPRQDVDQVKANIAALFKVSAAQVDALFSGKAVVLKKNIDLAAANRYRVAIKKAGARVDLVKTGDGVSTKPVAHPVPSEAKVPPAPKLDNAEENAFASMSQSAPIESVKTSIKPAIAELTLSAVGANLIDDSERERREPVNVDTSSLSIRENTGHLLDDGEWQRDLPVAVADLDADILPPGSDLLSVSERAPEVKSTVKALEVDIAPVGSRLEDEKPAPPAAPNVDHIQLAN